MVSLNEREKKLLMITIVAAVLGFTFIVPKLITQQIESNPVSEVTAERFENLFQHMANIEDQKKKNLQFRKRIGNISGEFINEKDVSKLISEIGEVAQKSNIKIKGYYPSINTRSKPLPKLEMKLPVECRFEHFIRFLDEIRKAEILLQPSSFRVSLKNQNNPQLDVQITVFTYLLDSKSVKTSPMKTIAGAQ